MEEKNKQTYSKFLIIILTAFVTALVTILIIFCFFIKGDQVGKYVLINKSEENDGIVAQLNKYRTIIDKYFLGNIDEEKLKEGAVKGYIEGLGDPYTEYISKDEMKDYLEDTKGNFVGIGIYMTTDAEQNLIKVLATMKGSPAENVGIKAGDLIKSVNDEIYTAKDLGTISSKIKGEEGTFVKLKILREGKELEFNIEREKIIVNQVEGKVIENNIGYIRIPSFDETTASEFKEKYKELKNQNIKGLIIDLRNNGGGIVTESLKIADYVADKDSVLLYEIDKNKKETIKKSKEDPIVNVPVIILVNENTASASEILAGALKDLGKAKIVGKKTYGKGIIQEILTLTDGSGLKITTEEYQTPNKTKIHEVGIEPDEKIELPKEIKYIYNIDQSQDTQLQKAIEMLK